VYFFLPYSSLHDKIYVTREGKIQMVSIVYQTNKKTGITYAYESISYWDKEKQQSRARRKCIGRVDPVTKEIIPTRKSSSDKVERSNNTKNELINLDVTGLSRNFYGATYLFDSIGNKFGITSDLKRCFPDTYKQIMSTAYFLILEDRNSLSRFPKWAAIHKHPYGQNIPSQRSSELFASISEESKMNFFACKENVV